MVTLVSDSQKVDHLGGNPQNNSCAGGWRHDVMWRDPEST